MNTITTPVSLPPGVSAMLARALSLYADGYVLRLTDPPGVVEMTAPPKRAGQYVRPHRLNLAAWTCSCDSFTGPRPFRRNDGRKTCKHLEGVHELARRTIADRLAFWDKVAGEMNGTADHQQRRMIHMGCCLEVTYGSSPRICQADESKDSAMALRTTMRTYRRPTGRRAEERRAA